MYAIRDTPVPLNSTVLDYAFWPPRTMERLRIYTVEVRGTGLNTIRATAITIVSVYEQAYSRLQRAHVKPYVATPGRFLTYIAP